MCLEALRVGRAEVERLHASIPVLIFLRDVAPDGSSRLVYRGGDFEHVTGWPAAELARHENLMRGFATSSDQSAAFLQRVMQDGSATIEWQFRQPDGSLRQVLQSGRRLTRRPDGGGEMVGYLVDVTAARAAEAKALAAGRLAALGEMSASLVHELRQPLQAIMLAAETAEAMAAELGAPELERRLARVVEQAERAGRVMEHLRRFARGDETTGAVEPVCIAQVLENTLLMTGGALREASVSVETALGDAAPVVAAQPLALEQVFTNLLLNARDAMAAHTPEGERRLRISATAAGDGLVRIEVADSGGGIAPEVMGRLFEPFVSTKPAETGTGLGLAICHGLVLGMGGTMQARNEDRGAVFTICLPAWAAAVADPESVTAG